MKRGSPTATRTGPWNATVACAECGCATRWGLQNTHERDRLASWVLPYCLSCMDPEIANGYVYPAGDCFLLLVWDAEDRGFRYATNLERANAQFERIRLARHSLVDPLRDEIVDPRHV